MMDVYAYTLSVSGRQPFKGLGTMDNVSSLLLRMDLLEGLVFDAVISNPTIIDRESGARTYIHAEGEKREWRLRWIPFL